MALKRRFSYQWRMFLPIVTMLWAILIIFAFYLNNKEKEMRINIVNHEMELINSRVITAYEHDMDIEPFMSFIKSYYDKSMFKGIRMSVYNAMDSSLLYCIGTPIPYDIDETPELSQAIVNGAGASIRKSKFVANNPYYFFGISRSNDGAIFVQTAMPYTDAIKLQLEDDRSFWVLIIILGVAMTIITYIYTRIGRNVTILQRLAQNIAKGEEINVDEEFPRDELGDVAREIIKLYQERLEAVEQSNHEHEEANKATKRTLETIKQLSNNINHELKTPVSVIKGYIDTMIDHPDMDEATRERFFVKIQEHVNRLGSMLDDLSTIAKLENAGRGTPREKVDMHELTSNIFTELQNINHNNMEFRFSIPQECFVFGNYNLIYGMIMNLVRNAFFYSHGTFCQLDLIKRVKNHYVFLFYDDGTGVSEEHLPHMFERFYRIDKGRSRKNGGSGLGLPIVQNSIRIMGGEIVVRNHSPHGLEFEFTLPVWGNERKE